MFSFCRFLRARVREVSATLAHFFALHLRLSSFAMLNINDPNESFPGSRRFFPYLYISHNLGVNTALHRQQYDVCPGPNY